jgi:carbamoylphosphate synthase small subunit
VPGENALLVLEDGTTLRGTSFGADAEAFGEMVVQCHPEAGPGPHDAADHFDHFCTLLERAR